jgi:PIN domain nuclease of toxin-antitoxin system
VTPRLLLDTHAYLWWLTNDPRLAGAARDQIEDARTYVAISAAVIWEISIKRARGKLRAPADLEEQLGGHLEAQGFSALPIRFDHAFRAGALPPLHRDPFDRMLVAQGQLEGLTIVTRDPNIARYDVPLLAA